ncbi:riboflavin synthase subunit alpha [Algibacillus agarilyticus]|uniref:riboflavin synthase subunit alpha n=1 Tax=Algibacillus agarilyticus TaxID=2234133 RepID=UPI000DD050C7|nr:riboflavin synthase subunit alpha [Algibacillus agarilyticus]
MFTGIVKLETQLQSVDVKDYGKRFSILLDADYAGNITLGASVALNGVCLTVCDITAFNYALLLSFDVIPESLRLTNLDDLGVQGWVNVERAARFGDDIGGHLLSGHIHTQATVVSITQAEKAFSIEFSISPEWQKYIMYKGYIGLNGCSLTLGEVSPNSFYVHLIPETLNITNFDKLRVGHKVNVEIDTQTQTIVDTIERVMASKPNTVELTR